MVAAIIAHAHSARALIFTLTILLTCSSAKAERYYAPVQIVKNAAFCTSLDEFKWRQKLIAEKRDEVFQGEAEQDVFRPTQLGNRCGTIPLGKFMFMEGYREGFACLRPRPGANCWWLKRDAIGENFELFPGRTIDKGNKGVTCDQWAKAATQAKQNLERDRQVIFANAPKNLGERFAQGMVADTLNLFTGSPNYSERSNSRGCLFAFRTMQEQARQLTAYDACPQLDNGGVKQGLLGNYNATIRYVKEFCVSY
jgi:hypothetical protein